MSHYHNHYYAHHSSHASSDPGQNSSSESLQALQDLSAVAAVTAPASFAGYHSDSVPMTGFESETVPRGQLAHPRFQARSPGPPQQLDAAVEQNSGEASGCSREAGHIVHEGDADSHGHSMVLRTPSSSGDGTQPAQRSEVSASAPSTPEASMDSDSHSQGSDPCSGLKNSNSAQDGKD
ncbi:unnamed protein product [Mortierella alpina]